MVEKETGKKPVQCDGCKDFHDVEIPRHMLEALYSGNLVIFAGAGISTENRDVLPHTLYDYVKEELNIAADVSIGFSELMSNYCAQADGRANLLRKIRGRFDYIKSFPIIYRQATRFHVELSTLHQVEIIVTTNWDDYFERECGAAPFVTSADYALWNVPGRKVFKLHGSINNYGSIIATDQDYKKCYKNLRDGILGSTLKHVLATKTIIYVGYSFNDEDFKRVHKLVKGEMKTLLPHGYIVTLDRASMRRFEQLDLTPIYTDAAYFLSLLKQHAVADGQMLDDERLDGIEVALQILKLEHRKLSYTLQVTKYPEVCYALCYQDGMLDSFERMLALKNTGYYSHTSNVNNAIKGYDAIRRQKLKRRDYFDVAYVDGYRNGLKYLLLDDKSRNLIPLYYIFGVSVQPRSFAEYKRLCIKAPLLHREAYREAKKVADTSPGLVIQHPPLI